MTVYGTVCLWIFSLIRVIYVAIYFPLSGATEEVLQCPVDQQPTRMCEDTSLCLKRKFSLEEPVYYNFARYNCRCDDACHLYGDCCLDADKPQVDYEKPEAGTMSCEKVPMENSFGLSVYMVNKCPSDFRGSSSIRKSCENGENPEDMFHQWIVSGDNGLAYANVYCAFCHKVEDPTFWLLNISCSKDLSESYKINETSDLDLLNVTVKDPTCDIMYSHPSLKFGGRFCKPMTASCSPDWPHDCMKEQCEHHRGFIAQVFDVGSTTVYKSPYCALCNNFTDYTCRDFITSEILIMYATQQNKKGFLPISVLFDLNTGYVTGIKKYDNSRDESEVFRQEVKSCPNKKVYHPSKGMCIDIVCGPGFTFMNGFCIKTANNESDLVSQMVYGCTYILLSPSEFTVNTTEANGTVLQSREPDGNTYFNGEFIVLENGSALVCSNYSRNFTLSVGSSKTGEVSFNFDKSQAVLSLVGQVLSILALSFQLFVYAILPPLRNLAGKNLMCLSASLLIAQIAFLVGISRTEIYGFCVFMAVLIHYSYLASFFWMNIMSFDIWRTFSRNSLAHAESNHSRHFKRYLIYGWAAPFSIVGIALMVDFSLIPDNPNSPAYGAYLCWINNKNALLIFFGMPILIIIIANTVFYIFTVYNIYKVQTSTRIATTTNKQPSTCQFLLYIKLCAIMGLTWVFAFIAMLGRLPVLWYLFIIFNSFQGVFICLTFVLTAKVLRMLSEKLRKLCVCNGMYRMVSRDDYDKSRSTRTSKLSLSHTISHDANRRISHEQVLLHQVSRDDKNHVKK